MMIGPSAPNGPPDPIEIAADTGFSTATRGSTRLPLIRMASMASGMPWPRMRSDPYRAIRPMISAPVTGTRRIQGPSVFAGWRRQRGADSLKEEEIGEEIDQEEQTARDIGAHDPDANGEQADRHHPRRGGEVAETARCPWNVMHARALRPRWWAALLEEHGWLRDRRSPSPVRRRRVRSRGRAVSPAPIHESPG